MILSLSPLKMNKLEKRLSQDQIADKFARKHIVDDDDFMFQMWYYWHDVNKLYEHYKVMPKKQIVLKMNDLNFWSTLDPKDEMICNIRTRMFTAYDLADMINIYNMC